MSLDPQAARDALARGRGNISRWSIEHPDIVIAFYLGVALLSALAIFFQMPRRMMPYVESPIVGVVSMMPGLSAEDMEIYFSKPIEERMVDLKNVHFVRSTSQEGISIVSIEFWYGTDMEKALFDVQSLMNVVQADLPMTAANLKPCWVLAIDPLNIPVLTLAVTGEGYDGVQLRTLVENELVNRLKVVKDVYSVVPFGGQKLQMQVVVDRERLAAYKLTLLDLKAALDMQNVWSKNRNDSSMSADGYSVGVGVTLPLFDGFQRENAVNTVKAEGLARQQIAKEVTQAALVLRAAETGVEASRTGLAQAEEESRVVKERFESGRGVQLEILDAQVSLTRARFNAVAALAEYNTPLAMWLRATGPVC